jgi:4-hydroxy-tetrahydrodipicolinate synthase
MSAPFPCEGILAALAIPTDADRRVRRSALARHLAWLGEHGVDAVFGLASSTEFPLFSLEERKAALATIAELAEPLPVVANISDIRSETVAELARFARRLELPGVAIMPPSFYPVSAADQLAFLLHTAETAQLPVMLYNFPELTGNRLGLETIAAFADRAPMAAIKQSGDEFAYHRELIALGREKDFVVFSGADTRLPEVFSLGATGCVGGFANFVPEYLVETFRICRKGAAGDAAAITDRLRTIGSIIDRLQFPRNVTAGLEARGFDPGEPRTIVSQESRQLYLDVIADLQRSFRAWDLAVADNPTIINALAD